MKVTENNFRDVRDKNISSNIFITGVLKEKVREAREESMFV